MVQELEHHSQRVYWPEPLCTCQIPHREAKALFLSVFVLILIPWNTHSICSHQNNSRKKVPYKSILLIPRNRIPFYVIESLQYKRNLKDSRHNLLLEKNAVIRVHAEKRGMKIDRVILVFDSLEEFKHKSWSWSSELGVESWRIEANEDSTFNLGRSPLYDKLQTVITNVH